MFGSVLGGIRKGALSGSSFLVALLLLDAFVLLTVRACEVVAWLVEQPMPADLASNPTVEQIAKTLQDLPDSVGLAAAMLSLLLAAFAHLNLLAQRFRDMGLPGWRWGIGLGAAASLVCLLLPLHQSLALFAPVLLALVFIPSGTFRRWRQWFGLPRSEIALADKSGAG